MVADTNRLVQPVAQTYTTITHGSYSAAASAGQFPPRLAQPVNFLNDCIVNATIGGQRWLTQIGWCSRLLKPTSLTHDRLTGSAGGSAATCCVAGAACRPAACMVVFWCGLSFCTCGSTMQSPMLSLPENIRYYNISSDVHVVADGQQPTG